MDATRAINPQQKRKRNGKKIRVCINQRDLEIRKRRRWKSPSNTRTFRTENIRLEKIVEEVESNLQELPEKEIETSEIGQFVMDKLKKLDKVAYVRFASVYRDFKDVSEFKKILEKLLKEK